MSVVDVSPPPKDDSEPATASESPPQPDPFLNMACSAILTVAGHLVGTPLGWVDPSPATISLVFLSGFLSLMVVDTARVLWWYLTSTEGHL